MPKRLMPPAAIITWQADNHSLALNTQKTPDPQLRVELKRDRTVALGMTNLQITETKSNSLVIGVGYKITEVPNPFGRKKGSKLPIQLLKNTS
ncbi:MAG: hypothetical protein ACK54P_12780, partial [Bacteroidota bacterium]